jgi:hypothetical protein
VRISEERESERERERERKKERREKRKKRLFNPFSITLSFADLISHKIRIKNQKVSLYYTRRRERERERKERERERERERDVVAGCS